MITRDTPLQEIPPLLPTESAKLLLRVSEPVQTLVLTDLRSILAKWEQSGVHLDPITFAATVIPIVETLVIDNMTIVSFSSRTFEGAVHDDQARP